MPEAISVGLAIAAGATPLLQSVAKLIIELKSKRGAKKVEELREDMSEALEAMALEVESQRQQIESLRSQVEYLSLPFWRRWRTPRPGVAGEAMRGLR